MGKSFHFFRLGISKLLRMNIIVAYRLLIKACKFGIRSHFTDPYIQFSVPNIC